MGKRKLSRFVLTGTLAAGVLAIFALGSIPSAQAQIKLGTSGGARDDTGTIFRGLFEIPVCCSGTLGALLKKSTDDGTRYVLSNTHVIDPGNPSAGVSRDIIAPGLPDLACVAIDDDVVADLTASVLLVDFDAGGITTPVDAAIATVVNVNDFFADGAIKNIGPINGTATAVLDQSVMKQGSTSDLTFGTVALIDADIDVFNPDACGSETGINVRYVNQIFVSRGRFAEGGDSGSVVLTTQSAAEATGMDGVKAIGMLYAGNNRGVAVNPIQDVLNQLSNELGLALSLVTGSNSITLVPRGGAGAGGPPGAASASLQHAIDVKNQHVSDLFDTAGVVLVGVGLSDDGEPVIVVHLESAIADADQPLPTELDGVSVIVKVSGPVVAY